MTEEFTIKVQNTCGTGMKWLRRNGQNVTLHSRKALRNFVRNNLQFVKHELYMNGEPFSFGGLHTVQKNLE